MKKDKVTKVRKGSVKRPMAEGMRLWLNGACLKDEAQRAVVLQVLIEQFDAESEAPAKGADN